MRNIRKFFILLFGFLAITSSYIFSRFTVDDAFISWRYGKNFINTGIWNYNPTNLDLTQAYTNPIFAALSIIPNYLNFDVVIFFKLLSIAITLGFFYWIYRASKGAILMPLALVALPATVVHIYSGLETFLFVVLTAALLVSLWEEKKIQAVLLSILLFSTRPETWLLLIFIPLYFFAAEPRKSISEIIQQPKNYFQEFQFRPIEATILFFSLAIPLGIYFCFHKIHFSSALPNTFYIKSKLHLEIINLLHFSLFLIPILGLILLARLKLTLLMAAFFGAMVLIYSTSDLQMNYAGRFAFHIFAPIYIFSIYVSSRVKEVFYFSNIKYFHKSLKIKYSILINFLAIFFLIIFAKISENTSTFLATYYPRAIFSHAELGKVIHNMAATYNIRAFALGDAGMAAYHANINSLDIVGLGSAEIAKRGMSHDLLDRYQIDLIAFYANKQSIILNQYNQKIIYDWSIKNGLIELCDIYWQKDYTLRIFARNQIKEIQEICHNTEILNSRLDKEMLSDAIINPPWIFWRE